jgi:hypothetical protein
MKTRASSPAIDHPRAIALARDALMARADLAGAGQSIMASYRLSEARARELHQAEVTRRKRERPL